MNYPGHIVIPITPDELYVLAKDCSPTRIMRRGRGIFTCCPVPDHGDDGDGDQDPSLWLSISSNGKTLAISCKAGCNRNVVAAALVPRLEKLKGDGVSSGVRYVEDNGWEPVDYAPVGTEVPSNIISREWKISPREIWAYRNPEGRISHVVYRYEKDAEKIFEDLVWCRNKRTGEAMWRMGWFPTVFNLLWSELLANFPGKPVLVVEGEKAAEAARKIFADRYFVTTWALGMAEAHRPDWSILKGREVILWPDNDGPGLEAMRIVAACLVKAGVEDIKMVGLS